MIEGILAGTDLSVASHLALRRAARLARDLGARLEVLHVAESAAAAADPTRGRALQTLAEALAQQAGAPVQVRVASGEPAQQLMRAAAGAQLLVVGAARRSAIGRLLLGTTVDRLLERSLRPVLVARAAPDEPYERVLACLDDSPHAPVVLSLARAVAPRAALTALQVIEPGSPQHAASGQRGAPERLEALLVEAWPAPSPRAVPQLAVGEAVPTILAAAARTDAQLIVAGRHGRSRLEALRVGSTTRRLVAGSDRDVLVATGASTIGFDPQALPPPLD